MPGATLNIYVDDGKILFDNNSKINEDGVPENVVIYGTSNTDDIEIKNDLDGDFTSINAVIFAPDSNIVLDNNAQLFGALIGDQVLLKNDAKIHFDESLITTTKVFEETPKRLYLGSIIQY